MAKGNLFLGTARKSVGDVVMYRRNGEQVSRVRVRKIANPQSDSQCVQRSRLAAVTAFYSPLSSILEKSFQGKNRSESVAAFTSRNVERVRELGVFLSKGTGFYPLPLTVSEGTLTSPVVGFYRIQNEGPSPSVTTGLRIDLNGTASSTISAQEFSNLLKSTYGLQDGDQVTVVLILGTPLLGFRFETLEFAVGSDYMGDLSQVPTFVTQTDIIGSTGYLGFESETVTVAGGFVIFTRFNNGQWQRSTSQCVVDPVLVEAAASPKSFMEMLNSYKNKRFSPQSSVFIDYLVTHGGSSAMGYAIPAYSGTTISDYVVPISAKAYTQNGNAFVYVYGTRLGGSDPEEFYVRVFTTAAPNTSTDYVLTSSGDAVQNFELAMQNESVILTSAQSNLAAFLRKWAVTVPNIPVNVSNG